MNLALIGIPVIFGLSIEVYFILLVIAIPTYFFWQWFFKKYIKLTPTRKILTWTTTVMGTPVIYVALIMVLMFGMQYTPGKEFDRSQWLTCKENRFQMAGDIISSKMLIRKDSVLVKQILGEPTWSNDSAQQGSIITWTYDMGMGGGGLGFLIHALVIKFDKLKVVAVEHEKIRD